jgi:hypothetical protein
METEQKVIYREMRAANMLLGFIALLAILLGMKSTQEEPNKN